MVMRVIEQHVTLEIRDTGPGIDRDERERVFDPFYRVLGNEESGSGLGLSIAKTAAERIAATIELHHTQASAPHGLTVIVKFRRYDAVATPV